MCEVGHGVGVWSADTSFAACGNLGLVLNP